MNNRFDERKDRVEEAASTSLVHLFGQIVMLPITVLVQSVELLVRTMRGMQRVADDGMGAIVGDTTQSRSPSTSERVGSSTTSLVTDGFTKNSAETMQKEERKMPDRNLGDDMLKLVRYKVLFVKRDYEVAFPEQEELVYDNMTDSALTAWKIAEFIQSLGRRETKVPSKWGEKYPPHGGQPAFKSDGFLLGFPEDDKKYLRVYFEVLERYPREKLYYEDRQLEVLEDIASGVRKINTASGSGTGPQGRQGGPTK